VFDGPTLTRDATPDFVTVGFVDGEDFGGTFEPGESGSAICGTSPAPSGRRSCPRPATTTSPAAGPGCSQLFNAWQAAQQADQTLGGVVASSGLSADLQPVQNTGGSAVRLAVTLTYTARGL
jgi:hypothetical protein